MGAFVGGLIGEGAKIWGQGAENRGGQSALGLGGQIDGFQRDDGRRGQAFGKSRRQPVKGAALAAAGRSEQADGEGRGRVGAAQQFGKAFEKRRGLRRQREAGGGNRRVSLETRRRGGAAASAS